MYCIKLLYYHIVAGGSMAQAVIMSWLLA